MIGPAKTVGTEYQPFSETFEIPQNTFSYEVQIICGEVKGKYYFDNVFLACPDNNFLLNPGFEENTTNNWSQSTWDGAEASSGYPTYWKATARTSWT